MKRNIIKLIKKGFGVIELILLLTVVVILSTTIYITINQTNKKPVTITETNTVYTKDDPDYLTIDAINSQLKNKKFNCVYDTIRYLETKGYGVDKLSPQNTSYEFVYSKSSNCFGILNNNSIKYPEELSSSELNPNIWRFISKSPLTLGNFSYYLLDSFEGQMWANGGVDVGLNEDVTEVNISNTKFNGEIIVRTTNAANDITINVTKGSVKHFGLAGNVVIKEVPYDSYYEYGKSVYLTATKGKIIAKNGGYIDLVYVAQNKVSLIEDGGYIEQAYCVSTDEIEGGEYGFNKFSESQGGNKYIQYYIDEENQINTTQNDIDMLGRDLVTVAIENTSFEGVLLSNNFYTQIMSFSNFISLANQGYSFSDSVVKLLGDIDLKNTTNFTPINNFNGLFDGNNHTIRNLTIDSNSTSSGVGLFSNASNATFRNLNLCGVNISAPISNSNVGGLIGQAEVNVRIQNCSIDSSSTIVGCNVGGFVGTIILYGTNPVLEFTQCRSEANLIGSCVGGLVSRLQMYKRQSTKIGSSTLIQSCSFNGKISGNSQEISYLGGFVGQEINGNNLSKLVVADSYFNGSIKGRGNIVSPVIAASSYRMLLNDVYVNDEMLIDPTMLGGIANNNSLIVYINGKVYFADFNDKKSCDLPTEISEEDSIVVTEDFILYRLINKESYDIWQNVINLELDEQFILNYKNSIEVSYVGFDPTKFINSVVSKTQQKRYVAGYDNVNECEIYKFDMFRIVSLEQENVDEWMDELALTEGVYFDDPTPFVDTGKYEITTYELENSDDDIEEVEEIDASSSEEEEIYTSRHKQKTKITVYKVTIK